MWLRLSELAKRAVAFAQEEAQRQGETGLRPEWLLLGCVDEEDGMVSEVFARIGVRRMDTRSTLESIPAEGSVRSDNLIEAAEEEARSLNSPYVGPEHLMLAVLRDSASKASAAMQSLNINYEDIREAVASLNKEKL